MRTFHVNVHARPSGLTSHPDDSGVFHWKDNQRVFDEFLPVSFETAVAALAQRPRVDVEPDGFFTCSGAGDHGVWQVSGHLFDFGGRLHRVELHGRCPVEEFEALVESVASDDVELVFELVREGVLVDRRGFRRFI